MSVTVVIGLQWGDEGKGKISHYLAQHYDIGVRFNGGPNAGHTIYHEGKKVITHLLPATALYNKPSVLTPGVLVDPAILKQDIENTGISSGNLLVDDRCAIIEQHDIEQDRQTGKKVGTTGRGIGPCIVGQVHRNGRRAADYEMGHGSSTKFLRDCINIFKDKILCEGAQGHYLDLWHGTYPYVTSSMCTVGAVCTNAGIPPQKISKVIGVIKAYCTRVGNGPFPTELGKHTEEYQHISKLGQEFGSTTGRERRIGWLDLVAVKEACEFNGVTELALTKSDVLNGLGYVMVAVDRHPRSGRAILRRVEGWENLKAEFFRRYVDLIEEFTKVKVGIISAGPERDQTYIG